jgi:undecaprenyl-diphosphatase
MFHSLIIVCAKYLFVLPVFISVFYWLFGFSKPERVRYTLVLVACGVLAYLLAKVGGHFYYDTRPFVADHFLPYFPYGTDNGFPSDHTLVCALFAAVMWPFRRKVSAVLYGIAIVVGTARVISGVHHPIDIIGALVIASLAVWLANLVVGFGIKKFGSKK